LASLKAQSCWFGIVALLGLGTPLASGQNTAPPSVELALTFSAQRSLQVNTTQNFWAEGAAAEIGVDAFRGFGIAANFTGARTSNIGTTGTALSLVTVTFGPRYRWHDGHRLSLYGEGLVGEANAFSSLFPSTFGAQTDANALATQVGGGVDLRLSHHVAVRALEASWLRTQFPNSTSDIQNNLLLGAGIVIRAGK
jgi:hypothetical protein